VNRPDVGEFFGLDISLGQLLRCQSYTAKKGWNVDLFLGNGEQLPYRDESFAGVFHVGGINFFNDKQAAIDEMIRVAQPGALVLIADETEKGFGDYERFFPGFKRAYGTHRKLTLPPVDLVPASMLDTRVFDAWNGFLYCIEFRKP
jgi:ubiquinone/menaquinone biosynthesis C-methylase UbiE